MRAMLVLQKSSGQLKRGSQPYLIPCGELTTSLTTTLHFFVHDVLLSFTHTARLSCLTGIKRLYARHPILHRWRSLGPFQFAGRYSRLVGFRRVIRSGCHYSPTAFKSGLPSGLLCCGCFACCSACCFSRFFNLSINNCFIGGSSKSSKDSLSIA